MHVVATERHALVTDADVVAVRRVVRERTVALRFSLVDQTKMVTAASELARNVLVYGGGGRAHVETVADGARRGLRVRVEDDGPGIGDVALALSDGYTSGTGLGLGLGGARRLVHDFEIESAPGRGTRVAITRWVSGV